MNINLVTVILLWIVLPLFLWKVVPKKRVREGFATFHSFQFLTWLFSISLTAGGALESPYRIFHFATKISFTMEFLVYPTIAVLFQLTFPKKAGYLRRCSHYFLWIGVILLTMTILGRFTDLIVVNWELLLLAFFNFLIELWLCHHYVVWLMKGLDSSRIKAYAN